ncbi:M28 family peptidase [candidate division KSB1 bacterium]|nr:M28 family peptidase [candidate division KSB1 bacterium]
MKKIFLTLLLLLFVPRLVLPQNTDSLVIQSIFSEALTNNAAYDQLQYLCENTAGRMTGTPQAAKAVEFTKQVLETMNLDTTYLQPVQVPHWVKGDTETASVQSAIVGFHDVTVCALGYSIGTGINGIRGNIIEVNELGLLEKLGKKNLQGKIVFLNRPMDRTKINPMAAYSGAADQRVHGAAEAAKYGAIGVVVRSLTTSQDDFPHTGVMRYQDGVTKIPAIAISTNDAERLHQWLTIDANLLFYMRTTCTLLPDATSYNVIGEIRGTEHPDEIIVVSGHLDAWFNTEGAHDDATGCVHALETLRLLKALHIQPKRTIRCVLFMDEEIWQTGGNEYARIVGEKHEQHLVAIESDRGGLLPLGFTMDAPDNIVEKFAQFKSYFENVHIDRFEKGHGGVDIGPLKELGIPLVGFLPSTQRYFDYHHSANDTFEQVNVRELQLGSAAIASLVYLIDRYGL